MGPEVSADGSSGSSIDPIRPEQCRRSVDRRHLGGPLRTSPPDRFSGPIDMPSRILRGRTPPAARPASGQRASNRSDEKTRDNKKECIRRVLDHRSGGSGRCSQAPQHVYRLHRRARPAPPGVGGRRQLGRRGDGRPRRHRDRDAAGRRRGDRRGQRPRHPGRDAPEGEAADHRGRHDDPARRRQVRFRFLRGFRRPARRRHLGGQRAVHPARCRDPPRRPGLRADLQLRQARPAEGARQERPRPAPPSPTGPTAGSSRPPNTTSRRCPAGCRKWRS